VCRFLSNAVLKSTVFAALIRQTQMLWPWTGRYAASRVVLDGSDGLLCLGRRFGHDP
jgi:hypothetical protein